VKALLKGDRLSVRHLKYSGVGRAGGPDRFDQMKLRIILRFDDEALQTMAVMPHAQ